MNVTDKMIDSAVHKAVELALIPPPEHGSATARDAYREKLLAVLRAGLVVSLEADQEITKLRCIVTVLRNEIENRRDEADRERLVRRDMERWLAQIKETLRPFWQDSTSNWDGSLCGLPTVVDNLASRIVLRPDEEEEEEED